MMYTLHELYMSCLGLLTLPVFFLAPGYVSSSACNVLRFRNQGWIERLLWATALSAPLSLLLATHPFVKLSPPFTTATFLLLLTAAVLLGWRDWKKDGPRSRLCWDRQATIGACGSIFLVLYCIVSALPFEVHGRLYENVFWQDWNVRLQLVNAAIRGGTSPNNPMFAPGGEAAPLRYYYFWYILCARMHDVVPVSTRAIFTVSCAGASLSLLAFLFLSVKYLGPSHTRLRPTCIALMVAGCILGLDAIAFPAAALTHHFYPNLQFWLEDRTPRLLHTVLWSPHHAAGLACAGLGTMLVVCSLRLSPRQKLVHMALAGICFAAAAGTSTFITILFSSALLFLCVDALFRKERTVVWVTLGAAVLSLLLDASFLHKLMTTPAVAATTSIEVAAPSVSAESVSTDISETSTNPQKSGVVPLMRPLPRYMNQSLRVVWYIADHFGRNFLHRRLYPKSPNPRGRTKLLLSILHRPLIVTFFIFDLGFFVYVLFHQAREDFVYGRPMRRSARLLWLIFLGIGIPGTRFTSAPLQTNNDFARHAGLGMEFVLLLWAAPLMVTFWEKRKRAREVGQSLPLTAVQRVALACALLGLTGQIGQILLDRFQVPLTDAGLLPRVVLAEYIPHIGFRFQQVQEAMAAAARMTATRGIVQANPHSLLAPVVLLYTSRQMVASDDGCNTPFGGDPHRCLPLTRTLVSLYGGTGPHYFTDLSVLGKPLAFRPELVTVENLSHVCTSNKIDVIAVAYTDPVWWDKASWVWSLQPSYSNSTMRLYPCPPIRPRPAL